jgi:uncharacterized membrane protein
MTPCPIKENIGLSCPGCGIQRSFWALIEGDISTSISFYPALIPFLGLLIFTGLHLKFKIKNGHKITVAVFCINILLITVGFVNNLRKDFAEKKALNSSNQSPWEVF